jgi:hypothetical protein
VVHEVTGLIFSISSSPAHDRSLALITIDVDVVVSALIRVVPMLHLPSRTGARAFCLQTSFSVFSGSYVRQLADHFTSRQPPDVRASATTLSLDVCPPLSCFPNSKPLLAENAQAYETLPIAFVFHYHRKKARAGA